VVGVRWGASGGSETNSLLVVKPLGQVCALVLENQQLRFELLDLVPLLLV
jgi:hypothetical protein